MKTIGLVICFFGKLPRWTDLFIESCRYNPTIDFLLMMDSDELRGRGLPDNVKLFPMDRSRFERLATQKFGFEVHLERPYKLIDFRPAWGVVFDNYLAVYDFWGYCDLDVIFGDIRRFLGDDLLDAYDVIATRKEFLTGHFTLFRNIGWINRLYELSRDFPRVFQTSEVLNFEECGGSMHYAMLKGAPFAELASQAKTDSMMHILARTPEVRVHQETVCEEWFPPRSGLGSGALNMLWKHGRIFDLLTGQERMYFHLIFLKLERRVFIPRWKDLPSEFRITLRGFIGAEPGLRRRLATAAQREWHFLNRSLWVTGHILRREREALSRLWRARAAARTARART